MRLKLFLFVFGLFLIGNVLAGSTVVEVKTLPYHWVYVTPIEIGGGFNALSTPEQGFSGEFGDVKFVLDVDENQFDLNFLVKDVDYNLVLAKKIRDEFFSGEISKVEVLPDGVEPLVKPEVVKEEIIDSSEEVIVNETDEVNESVEVVGDSGFKRVVMNGYSMVEENKPMVNSIYYSVLGFTALLLIFLTIRKNGKKVDKIEHKKGEVDEIDDGDELEKAKAKVRELEAKRNGEIESVKKKLIEDQKELLRLRGVKEKNSDVSSEEMKKRLEEKLHEKD